MAEVIRMPRMSDTMEEGNIVAWLKNVGDTVEPGDILAEVETDKATMELESYHEGTLLYIGVKEGPVPVDGLLAVIGEQGEDYKAILDLESTSKENGESEDTTIETGNSNTSEKTNPSAVSDTDTENTFQEQGDLRIKISPLAKKMAVESGISIDAVSGTGEGGRIVKRDIEAFKTRKASLPAPIVQIAERDNTFTYGSHPVSQMRKTIAKRLSESKFGAPHFYLTIDVNMSQAVQARKDINEISDIRISFNDLVIKAAAAALRKHPKINSSWKGDHIVYHQEIHIGVAVAVEEGLLVPVIRNTDLKSLSRINTEVKDLALRAKNRKLSLEEMQGNTFTISNLGMFGIDEFTAIINPPDACILAVGSIIEKPIVKDGQIVPAHMMKLTLSCDHRVVDGATGAQFLQSLQAFLENPVRILL